MLERHISLMPGRENTKGRSVNVQRHNGTNHLFHPRNPFVKERLLIADMAIASCEFMFEETRNYVKQRKAFGKTIAHLQVSI